MSAAWPSWWNTPETRPRKLVGYFRDTLELTDEEMEHYFGAAMRRIEEEEAAWA